MDFKYVNKEKEFNWIASPGVPFNFRYSTRTASDDTYIFAVSSEGSFTIMVYK